MRRGRVRVAGDTTVGTYVLPDAVAAFHREQPHVELSLSVVNRARVRQLLLAGNVDVGVVGSLWDDDALVAEPFLDHSLLCFCAPDHPLVAPEALPLAALLDGPLLLREPGSGTRASVERILARAGVDLVASMELASNGALKRAVAGGLGVTVLSEYAVRLELEIGLLRPLRVEGFPARRTWNIVWARDRLLSPASLAFQRFVHDTAWRQTLARPLGTDSPLIRSPGTWTRIRRAARRVTTSEARVAPRVMRSTSRPSPAVAAGGRMRAGCNAGCARSASCASGAVR